MLNITFFINMLQEVFVLYNKMNVCLDEKCKSYYFNFWSNIIVIAIIILKSESLNLHFFSLTQ